MKKEYLVTIMRKDLKDLPRVQVAAIRAVFPEGARIRFLRTDPVDFREHLADCERLKPDLVFLPEEPIPGRAMQAGVGHGAFRPNGTVEKLLPFVPPFTAFKID